MKRLLRLSFIVAALSLLGNRASAQAFSTHNESLDSLCGWVVFNATTTGCTSGQTVKIYYGDGASSTNTVSCGGSTGYVWGAGHAYAASGTYTVKEVLYVGTTAVDSIIFSMYVTYCQHLFVHGYHDANSNCTFDLGTDHYLFAPVSLEVDSSGVPIDTVSMLYSLYYPAYGAPGTVYDFKVITPPAGMVTTCPSTGIVSCTVPPVGTLATPAYLGFECGSSSAFDLSISAAFRPALAGSAANKAFITVHNTNCTGTAATVKFEYGPKYSFGSVTPASSYTVTGSSVLVDIGTVTPFVPKNITVALTPTVTLTIGDTVNTKFTVLPTSGDADPSNNVVIRCDSVRASWDPNAKSVTPTGNVTAGTTLEYMLQFENDGNDTAYNIHIMDTLSNNLDINTFKITGATHRVDVLKYANAGSNILKFDFADIKLPDSSHHDYCRGAVTFTIKAKSTLTPGAVIANRVGIYFDVNPVVMTNTVYSQIPLITGVKNVSLSAVELYPNPVSDVLNIRAENGAYTSVVIYNSVGQVVNTQNMMNGEVKVNVRQLAAGIYYAAIKGAEGTRTIKFEKQ